MGLTHIIVRMNLKGERQIRRCVFMSSIKRPVREFHVVVHRKAQFGKVGRRISDMKQGRSLRSLGSLTS